MKLEIPDTFPPIEALADLYSRTPADKALLMTFARRLLDQLASTYCKVWEQGMSQATHLMLDPAYAEKKKRYRKESILKRAAREKEEATRKAFEESDPKHIEAKRVRELKLAEQDIAYHSQSLTKATARREALRLGKSEPDAHEWSGKFLT